MRQEQSATATRVKNLFGSYLGRVVQRREPLLIKRHKKPVAVLVDYDSWVNRQPAIKKSQTPWTDAVRQFCEKMKKRHPNRPQFSAVEAVKQIREEES